MNILHICANPKPTEESTSKQLAMAFFLKVAELNADVEVENIDLYSEPPPYLSYEEYRNAWFPVMIEGYVPTKEEEAAAEYAMTQAAKVNNSDVLVLTMPMWNYTIPAIMKSWLEHVIAPGMTYHRERNEITPLHKLKKVIFLIASGDQYKEGDPRDALGPALTACFEEIGVEDIAYAWADGQDIQRNRDAEERKKLALEMAEELAEDVLELAGEIAD